MTYVYRDGTRSGGVTALVAGAELERIRLAHDGQLLPEAVVEEARPEDAPLHPVFEWDDAVAGELYRLNQARYFIRCVRIVLDESSEEHRPAYVHVTSSTSERYYQSATVAVGNVDEWASAVAGLQGKLTALARSVEDLRRIAGTTERPNAAAIISLAEKALSTVQRAIDRIAA